MEKIIICSIRIFLVGSWISFSAIAQVPQSLNYQAVARDAAGNILANQTAQVRYTIHDAGTAGPVLYQETHSVTTNQFGLFTAAVGNGTVALGNFSTIDWSLNTKYLQVEIDLGGGYIDMGASQLLSVPYALYAASSPASSSGISGTADYVAKFSSATTVANSQIYDNGNFVGIGSTTAVGTEKLLVENTNGVSIYGIMPSGGSNSSALQGDYNGTGSGSGIMGLSLSGTGDGIAGVKQSGMGMGTSGMYSGSVEGYGIYGNYNGSGSGAAGRFESATHTAVIAFSLGSYGLRAQQGNGSGSSPLGFPAVWADADTSFGLMAMSGEKIGVIGLSFGTTGAAYGIYGESDNGGLASIGVAGFGTGSDGTGVYGEVSGASGTNYAVYGVDLSANGLAGAFEGGVTVTGDLNVGGAKNFIIDHPLDPANKVLYHHCVESSDVMNIYNGNITTDAAGHATVLLPDYFEALNKDYKYQLTCIGAFAQAIVSEEIRKNKFVIATDKPGIKVSWQVSGVRNDKAMNIHVPVTERAKQGAEVGKYYCPEAYGFSQEMGALKNSGTSMRVPVLHQPVSQSLVPVVDRNPRPSNGSMK